MSFITKNINLIQQLLESGEIAAIPTETVYGLAADYSNNHAIEKIFLTKGRPRQHPLILHVLPEWDLNQWVTDIPFAAQELMKKHWPGPLSIVFKKKTNAISPLITGIQDSVAIRAPQHPMTQALLQKLGKPIVAPSANPFEKISPTSAKHVLEHFPNIDLAILDGGRCKQGMESTIIDMAHQHGKILRQGQLALTDCEKKDSIFSYVKVPGQHHRHYQPKKPLFYFESFEDLPADLNQFYILSFTKHSAIKSHYLFSENREQIFYEFYHQIHKASQSSYPMILIEKPQKNIHMSPILDRIQRAGRPILALNFP